MIREFKNRASIYGVKENLVLFDYQKIKKGFTFIDVLVGISLMLIVFLGILGAYRLGLKVVGQSKARITATAIANEKIEQIHNLPYKKVGTIIHFPDEPAGDIQKTENIIQNNINYLVETTVKYISDCFDGPQSAECPQAPIADDCVKDYKRVQVRISWEVPFKGSIDFFTDIAPKNLNQEKEECTGAAAGVLSISVFNALGMAVTSPLIEVIDPDTGLTLTSYFPSSGKYDFILPSDVYKLKVSKTNYSIAQTYWEGDIYDGKVIAAPAKSHPSVYEGKLTEIGLSIDEVGLMKIETRGTRGQGYPPVHNATFEMEGTKTVGNDSQGKPIYKYSQNHIVNGPAEINLSDLEWDSYNFSVNSPDYDLTDIESPAETTTTQPVDLLPADDKEVRLILKAENTLLVNVKDASTTLPIFGASVRIIDGESGYDVLQPTDENGKTIFIPLKESSYQLEVEANGYQNSISVIFVSGDETVTISLIPLP